MIEFVHTPRPPSGGGMPGFEVVRVATMRDNLSQTVYPAPVGRRVFYQRLLPAVDIDRGHLVPLVQ